MLRCVCVRVVPSADRRKEEEEQVVWRVAHACVIHHGLHVRFRDQNRLGTIVQNSQDIPNPNLAN